jgi:hypothetical protein
VTVRPFANHLLCRLGIDTRRYWLLLDLFTELGERREQFTQLGRDSMSLRKVALSYYILSALMTLPFVIMGMAIELYYGIFLASTMFLLSAMLISETGNSLVNPVEALVLSHQPIDGATYTAAKLTQLLRLLWHMVPGLAAIPALVGYLLKGCRWYYPELFLLSAFAAGLVAALACCALFGWLIRLVPPSRLKAAGLVAEALPWLLYIGFQFSGFFRRRMHVPHLLPAAPGLRAALAIAVTLAAVTLAAMGIRALSGDYLVRVAAIAQAASGARRRARQSLLGGIVARLGGGPPARAGFDYLSRMMLRDWQFRRQLLQLIPIALMVPAGAFQGLSISPFSRAFSTIHVLPHVPGILFFAICNVLVYGTDHRAAWLFLLAPAGAFRGFARGIYARLLMLILVPYVLLFVLFAWRWGPRDAALFTAYSMAAGAVYLSLELRLIDGMPFSKQPESTQNLMTLPLVIGGVMVMAVAVGLQYFLIFRSAFAVIAVTVALAATALFLTRGALEALETSMRFHLEVLSAETKHTYVEVQ